MNVQLHRTCWRLRLQSLLSRVDSELKSNYGFLPLGRSASLCVKWLSGTHLELCPREETGRYMASYVKRQGLMYREERVKANGQDHGFLTPIWRLHSCIMGVGETTRRNKVYGEGQIDSVSLKPEHQHTHTHTHTHTRSQALCTKTKKEMLWQFWIKCLPL